MTIDTQTRYRGSMVGTAVGDALGAPFEGSAMVDEPSLRALGTTVPGRYTDDTAMTMAVAASLVEGGGFDGEQMARRLADHHRAEPWRGYGAGPPMVFELIERGVSWTHAASMLFGGSGSYGNGAAMRVGPIGLFSHHDLDGVVDLARSSAIITHAHPEGVDGAVVQAVAVAHLTAAEWPAGIEGLVEVVLERAETEAFRSRLALLSGAWPGGSYAEVLGNWITASQSVVTALACFLAHPESFGDAIAEAIGQGGDTDTIAAMTGALAGAWLGLDAIPEPWQGVEGFERLVSLADGLHELSVGR